MPVIAVPENNRGPRRARQPHAAPATADELTWWHKSALRMFRAGANTQGIASALRTTEADAYNLLAQAREAARNG